MNDPSTLERRLITLEEFMSIPEDGVERWVIRGELREKRDTDLRRRGKLHGITEGNVTGLLWTWLQALPQPRGEVVCGDVGLLLRTAPVTIPAGVDVAVVTADQAKQLTARASFFKGPPVLIVEILSANDTQAEVAERVEEYSACGVPLVWVLNPYFRTVTIHRPGIQALALDSTQVITADPELPGFSAPVADFFG